jgi:hypothetical protein
MRLSGFTSRWTTPCACAQASASQSTTPMAAATSAGGRGALGEAPQRRAPRGARSPCSSRARRGRRTRTPRRCWGGAAARRRASRSKRAAALGVAREVRVQHLHRHVALEARVVGAVDHRHPAGAELSQHVVLSDAPGGRGGGGGDQDGRHHKPARGRPHKPGRRWRVPACATRPSCPISGSSDMTTLVQCIKCGEEKPGLANPPFRAGTKLGDLGA